MVLCISGPDSSRAVWLMPRPSIDRVWVRVRCRWGERANGGWWVGGPREGPPVLYCGRKTDAWTLTYCSSTPEFTTQPAFLSYCLVFTESPHDHHVCHELIVFFFFHISYLVSCEQFTDLFTFVIGCLLLVLCLHIDVVHE